VSQPVNVDGGRLAMVNTYLHHTMGGIDWGIYLSGSYNRSVNFVNSDISRNDIYVNGGGLNARKYVADKYSFQVNTSFSYFHSRSSVNSSAPIHYWSQSHSAAATLYIIPHYELGSNATYTLQGNNGSFAGNTSVVLWNAWLSRNFLGDKLTAKAVFNNILDQNSGITRSSSTNINTQTATNILGRYWMLSVIYHFDRQFRKR
jgi:hypothetical protein